MHQINILSFPSQIFWTISGFILIFFTIRNMLIPTLNSILNDRQILENKYKDEVLILQEKISNIENSYTVLIKSAKEKNKNDIDKIHELHQKEKDKINQKYHAQYKQVFNQIQPPPFSQDEIDKTVQNIRQNIRNIV